jgi:membrane protein DedA with SNARE-associated domain
MVELFSTFVASHPALVCGGIFVVLLLCGFGLPLPEDVVLAFTGYAVHRGVMPLWAAIGIGMAGVIIGDSCLWTLGHRYGKNVLRMRLISAFLTEARLVKIQRLYEKYGSRILFMARFTPVLRAGVFLFAGWAGVPYRRFLATDGSAALLSVPAIITFVYLLGDQIDRAIRAVRGFEHWILIAIGMLVVAHVVHGAVVRRRERNAASSDGATAAGVTDLDHKSEVIAHAAPIAASDCPVASAHIASTSPGEFPPPSVSPPPATDARLDEKP